MADLFDSDPAFRILEKSIDISARRQRMITNNIANIDTVGYAPKDLDFQEALKAAMQPGSGPLNRTHPKHLVTPSPMNRPGDARASSGEAPVTIDQEMAHLMENNLKYRTGVEMLLRKMGILKHAITEGGR